MIPYSTIFDGYSCEMWFGVILWFGNSIWNRYDFAPLPPHPHRHYVYVSIEINGMPSKCSIRIMNSYLCAYSLFFCPYNYCLSVLLCASRSKGPLKKPMVNKSHPWKCCDSHFICLCWLNIFDKNSNDFETRFEKFWCLMLKVKCGREFLPV